MGDPVQIIVLTRFSVYNYPSPMVLKHQKWIKSESQYLDYMYGDERMGPKMAAFEYLLVPSLKAQILKPTAWYIFTSPHLQHHHQATLQRVLTEIPNAKIVYINHYADMDNKANELTPKEGKFITVKLDDDDAFHPEYLERLANMYTPHTILSPKHGYMLSKYDFGKGRGMASHFSYPKRICASSGLAYAQGNILSTGDHMKVHRNYKNIKYIDEPNMFIRLIHDANFTKPTHKSPPFRFTLANYLHPERRRTRKKRQSHK